MVLRVWLGVPISTLRTMEVNPMEQTDQPNSNEIPVLTKIVNVRRDIVRLCAVEIAIYLKELLGTRVAAEYLRRHQVDLDVALRVLLHPSRRRFGV